MQKFNWLENYSVGLPEIDKQHQHFFEVANDIIHMTGQENVTPQDLCAKIDDLNNYSIYHFTTEENLFKKFAYPYAKEHIATHHTYQEKMDQFINSAKQEGADTKKIALEVAEFAGSWLMNHIMVMDQKYVGFIRENGIK
jgi:hemerythrin-like metal-binding protein